MLKIENELYYIDLDRISEIIAVKTDEFNEVITEQYGFDENKKFILLGKEIEKVKSQEIVDTCKFELIRNFINIITQNSNEENKLETIGEKLAFNSLEKQKILKKI